jgi:hypothetical protein
MGRRFRAHCGLHLPGEVACDALTVCARFAHDYSLRITPGLIRTDSAITADDQCVVLGILYGGSHAACDVSERVEETRTFFARYEPNWAAPPEISVFKVIYAGETPSLERGKRKRPG